jgi:hypothetical protein
MLRTLTIGLGAALCCLSLSAQAQTGYGVKPGAPSTSTFDRSWNRANESKDRARAGAEHVRRAGGYGHLLHHHAQ